MIPAELLKKIRELMEVVIPTDHVSIPLEKANATTWTGRLPSDPELDHAQYFLALLDGCLEQVTQVYPVDILGTPALHVPEFLATSFQQLAGIREIGPVWLNPRLTYLACAAT